MARRLSLILGGVRSGKSEFAEKLASELNKPTLYVATGLPSDAEMEQRIRRHQQARPKHWDTVEEPVDLAGCLELALSGNEPPDVVLVDSLDFWVSNLLHQHESEAPATLESIVDSALGKTLQVCSSSTAAVFLVSSEVGLTLIPPYPLGRRFQDLLGLVNQRIAGAADCVHLVVVGIPVTLKGGDEG